MQRYIFRRLLLTVPVALGVSIVVFSLIHLAPGDPVLLLLGTEYDPAFADLQRQQLGLDRPLVVQYLLWLTGILRGDLGRSITQHIAVTDLLQLRFPLTMLLAMGTVGVSVVIAIPVGVFVALRRGQWIDHLGRILSMTAVSMPVFWVGIILIIVFGLHLGWFPAGGSPRVYGARALVLPSVALGASFAALVMRIVRSSMLDVLRDDFIRTARAKGLAPRKVHYKHALRNALIPIVTVIGLQFGAVLGGAVLTETVFNIPGIGRLLVEAIGSRDYPLIQGTLLVTSLLFVLVNLTVDLLYAFIDPRIHYG